MMHPNPRKILPVALVFVVAVTTWWYLDRQEVSAQSLDLTASGTIEAVQVSLSSELGGKVLEVLANEGQPVTAGQVVVRFQDDLVQAQLAQAQAALQFAQANYDLVAAGMPAEQRQASVAAARVEILAAQQLIDTLNDSYNLMAAKTAQEIAAADKAVDLAQQRLNSMNSTADQADIDAAQAAVVLARDKLDKAREAFEPYENKPEDNLVRAMRQAKLAEAQQKYDALVSRLNNLLGTSNQYDLALAEANLTLAQEQLADARQRYEDLKDGPDPEDLAQAEARLEAARSHLAAAQAGPTPEQLAAVQAQVNVAQSAIELLQVQIEKLVIQSPLNGIVLSRTVEPGEVILPGATLLNLARLDELTLTIYLPEDRYGTVMLGEQARVTVDSFPGDVFTGTIIHIADQAEFTPRNVQTAEGRRTTVFAVKLSIENPEGRLKPGMPADVKFK